MANEFERIEKFEKMIESINTYISNPTTFLYEQIEDPTLQEIVECSRAIALNNYYYVSDKRENNEKLLASLTGAAAIVASPTISVLTPLKEKTIRREQKDLSEILELIVYSDLSDETMKILESMSQENFKLLKLQIYKLILDTKQAIRQSILSNPIADISSLQDKLNTYELILEFASTEIKAVEKEEQEELPPEYSNIIFAPNNKKSTYLYEDISEYSERAKEIKLIFEKLVDGYFLKTKDTKPIEGYQEKIFEYKHPNGIRILYIVTGNIITICSLFMKDKQKSSRITNEYDEAIARFYECKNYIEENFNNPDFHIEQAELVGEIFSLLDGITLSKKVGE